MAHDYAETIALLLEIVEEQQRTIGEYIELLASGHIMSSDNAAKARAIQAAANREIANFGRGVAAIKEETEPNLVPTALAVASLTGMYREYMEDLPDEHILWEIDDEDGKSAISVGDVKGARRLYAEEYRQVIVALAETIYDRGTPPSPHQRDRETADRG